MSDFEPIDDAVENVTTLSNCWLKLLHDFDCSTTQIRVEEVIQEILEALDGSDSVDEVQYHNRMHEASLLLRDWLKFEQQVKPMIDAGFSNTRLSVKVADLKNPAKKYRFYTPMVSPSIPKGSVLLMAPQRFSPADHELKSKGIVFKIPFGHLMARCAKLEVCTTYRDTLFVD
jgi:hypothetical protein